jgi:predicted dehydrogenase
MNKFECTNWEESAYAEATGGPKIGDAKMTFRYSGVLEGEGKSAGLLIYTADGSGTATGAEFFTGRVNGREGTVILETTNTFDAEGVTGTFRIVPGTGTGELADATGHGAYEMKMGTYATEYTFTS